jgi:cytidylate kinase
MMARRQARRLSPVIPAEGLQVGWHRPSAIRARRRWKELSEAGFKEALAVLNEELGG